MAAVLVRVQRNGETRDILAARYPRTMRGLVLAGAKASRLRKLLAKTEGMVCVIVDGSNGKYKSAR